VQEAFMGIGFTELIVVLVIILILFGPGKLPEIGKALGRGIREFKDAQNDVNKKITEKDEDKKDEK
jgi:sec-independent protein translocase protein TatA